jgi:hypothetical protein
MWISMHSIGLSLTPRRINDWRSISLDRPVDPAFRDLTLLNQLFTAWDRSWKCGNSYLAQSVSVRAISLRFRNSGQNRHRKSHHNFHQIWMNRFGVRAGLESNIFFTFCTTVQYIFSDKLAYESSEQNNCYHLSALEYSSALRTTCCFVHPLLHHSCILYFNYWPIWQSEVAKTRDVEWTNLCFRFFEKTLFDKTISASKIF